MPSRNPLQALRNPKLLLLAGGVFGFAAIIVWFASTYRLVMEPDRSQMPGAIGAVTFFDDSPEARRVVDAIAAASASSTGAIPLAPYSFTTVYAAPGARGGIALHTLVAGSDGGCHRCKSYLLPRSVLARGFVRAPQDGAFTPFELRLEGDAVIIRLGTGFSGLAAISDDLLRPYSGLQAVPDQTTLYYADHDFPKTISLANRLQFAVGETAPPEIRQLLENLGRFELIYGSRPGDALQPFVIHVAADQNASASSTPRIESAIKELVGTMAPHRDTLTLPDHSLSYEQRASTADVVVQSRVVHPTGIVKDFTDPAGQITITVFEDTDGELWISNHLELLQQILLANPQASIPMRSDCVPTSAEAGFIMYPNDIPPYLKAFKLISVLLKDRETGLLTICGYLK